MAEEVAQPQTRIMTHPSLMWQNHTDLAINVPGQVLYEEITADSTSTSGFSFNFRSPADNALLDNCVIIEYPISIYTDPSNVNWLADLNSLGGGVVDADRMDEFHIALRQCYAMARAIQNLSVTINGSNFNVQPIYWLDALNRLYFSEEEAATLCSSSGGEFDGPWVGSTPYYKMAASTLNPGADGDISASYVGLAGIRPAARGWASNVPIGSGMYFHNVGLEKRFNRFLKKISAQSGSRGVMNHYGADDAAGNTDANVAYNAADDTALSRAGVNPARADTAIVGADVNGNVGDGVSFSVFERLPIAPFLFHNSKDARMSIPNIRQVNITAQFATDLWKHVLQGEGNGQPQINGTENASTILKRVNFGKNNANKIKLHTRWYLTNNSIPPTVRLRAPKYLQYLKEITFTGNKATAAPIGPSSFSFSNIQLDAIPDKFFIFAARRPEDYLNSYPSEFYLSIQSLTLTIGGSSGRLTSLIPAQMYDNFLRQSAHGGEKKLEFEDWYKYHCVAILDAADIGLIAGPGYNYKTNMTVNLDLVSYWDLESVYGRRRVPYVTGDTKFNIVVLCCYNQHYIELNSSGGSKSGMTMVPRM